MVPRDRGCPNEVFIRRNAEVEAEVRRSGVRLVGSGPEAVAEFQRLVAERAETGLKPKITLEAKGEVSDPVPDPEKGRDEAASTAHPAAGVSGGSYRYRDREARKEYMKEYMRKRRLRGKVP